MRVSEDLDHLRSIAVELRDYVAHVRASVDDEIRTYPTPIPRCDAQFNFVYEQRGRLTELLNFLDAEMDRGGRPSQLASIIAGFLASSPLRENDEERDLRKRLADATSAHSLATPPTPG